MDETVNRLLQSTREEKDQLGEREKHLKEREEILRLLQSAVDEINTLKKITVKKDEIAKFFETFLDEFSHAVNNMEDTKDKGKFSNFVDKIREHVDAFKRL